MAVGHLEAGMPHLREGGRVIGAPTTKREKAVFYTVGLPFLLVSMAYYGGKIRLRRLVRRVVR